MCQGATEAVRGFGAGLVQNQRGMRLRLIRHATLLVGVAGQRLLVDPMLDAQGSRPAVATLSSAVATS